jgi:hypothetical protein
LKLSEAYEENFNMILVQEKKSHNKRASQAKVTTLFPINNSAAESRTSMHCFGQS